MVYENQHVLPYILVDNLFRFSIMIHILFIYGLFYHHVILQSYFNKCSIQKNMQTFSFHFWFKSHGFI